MSKPTKIILDKQSDLILTNAKIVGAIGILKSDLPGLVNDLSSLNSAIQTEASNRSTEISVERARIDSILNGSDINLDQFKEVVSFVQSIDMTNDADLLTAVTQINGKISTEEAARIAADDQLSADLATLQSYVDTTVDSAISQLTSDLSDETAARIIDVDAEETRAIAAETKLTSDLSDETASRIADVDAEETRAIAAEGVLQSNINTEANERVAEDITLQGNIDIESGRAQAAESSIASDLGTETSARIAADSAEEARATAAEFKLTTDLSSEVSRATAAEEVLQSNINTEKFRIDAILIGASASTDNFAEIVQLINSVDTTNDQVFAGYVLSNDTALADEISRAESAEGVLTSNLATEVLRAQAAESTLTSALEAETASRIASDSSLQSSLNNEISDRVAAGQSTQTALENESARAIAAEGVLSNSISAEQARAQGQETALQAAIDAETAARIAADDTIDGKIADIISNTDLTSIDSFTEVVDNLDDEITRAEAAEYYLQSAIDVEEARSTAAEVALQAAIDAETAARIAADDTIDGKIADIISNTDLTAIDSFTEVVDNLNAEITRAEAAEASIISDLSDETAARIADVDTEEIRAIAAEEVLQSKIDTEKGRIDAILQGSDVDLDQFAEVVSFVQSIDLSNDESLMNAVINIENSISQEVTDRESADLAIEDTISSLEQTLNSNISTLTNSLDTEISDRISAIESVEQEISNLTDSLDSSVMTINDSIDSVIASVAEEHAHHAAAEVLLQANIDVEKGRIDAILDGSTIDLDQFAEVVSFVQSIDLTNDDALLNAVISIEDSITDEAAERQAADSAIEDSISSLESNINSELSTLSDSFNTEVSDRISSIETVESSISDLTETLDTAILTINDSIDSVIDDLDAEVTRATAAEEVLQSNINTEKVRIDAILEGSDVNLDQFREVVAFVESIDLTNDEGLMNAVINIEDSISQEVTDRESADLVLEDMISNLDQSVSGNISTLTNSLDVEISDRIAAIEIVENEISDLSESLDSSVMIINDSINGLVTDLDAEVVRSTAAEVVLQANIDTEKGRIDAILAGSDVDLDQFAEVVSFVQSIDLTNDDALLNAVIGIENSIDDEIADRESADLAIQDTISTLDVTLTSNISILTDSLNTEISDRINAIETVEASISDLEDSLDSSVTNINTSIDAEVASLQSNLDAEEARAIAAEGVLDAAKLNLAGGNMSGNINMGNNIISAVNTIQAYIISTDNLESPTGTVLLYSNLNAQDTNKITNLPAPTNGGDATNKEYVDTADAQLQSNIDTEKGRIDAILDGSTVDLDQFAEVVAFVQSIDMTNDDALLTAVTSINDAIDVEVVRATAAEEALDAAKLDLAGGTMSGNITMGGNKIYDVNHIYTGSVTTDRFYSNNSNGILVNTNLSLDGNSIKNLAEPLNHNDAARKGYVDGADAQLQSTIDALTQTVNVNRNDLYFTITDTINNEATLRIADVDAEETRAIAAEGVLQSNINNEANERVAEDITLQGNISAEATRAQVAETAIAADLGTETASRIAGDAQLSSDLSALSSTFSSALSNEVSRSTAAEEVLQSNINTEKFRIDAILIGASASTDNFAEIVALINSVDTTNDTGFASYVLSNDAALAAEIDRATITEGVLQATLETEAARAYEAEEVISTNLSTEVLRATAAESTLTSALSAEESSRIAGDASLQASLNNEISDRIAAGQSAQTALDNESARAISAEGVLTSVLDDEISNRVSAVSTEEASRIAGDAQLSATFSSALFAEVSRATAAEGVLTSDLAAEVDDRVFAVSAEESARIAGDAQLSSDLSALSSTFSSALFAEVSRSTAAEEVLQSNIDTEKFRIDAILIGASASTDNFAEIVALINSVDTTNDQVFAGYVLSNDAALAAEVSRAQSSESALSATFSSSMAAEVSRATAVESQLTSDLSSEVSRATAAESALAATFSSAISNETSARIADVDAEEARAIAAETALSSDLSDLQSYVDTTVDSAIDNLTLDLSDETADRIAAVDAEETRAIAAEVALSATFSSALASETFRATAAEIQLSNDLSDEVSYRIDADTLLQSNIDTEKFRIDAILIGASASTDNFAEIVQLINSVDTTNDQVFAGYVLSNDAALAAEVSRSTAAESALFATFSSAIASEFTRATAAESALSATFSSAISGEESSRIAGDAQLSSDLSSEVSRAIAAEVALSATFSASIAAEVYRATAAELVLTTDLSSEVSRATAAESALSATFSSALSAETARAIAAELVLTTDFANIYSKKVTVSGTTNGVLTTFTLALPVRIGSEMIYVNGLLMEEGEDYTTIVTSGKVSGVEFLYAPSTEMKVRAYGVCGL